MIVAGQLPMDKTGQELEQLVAEIEARLLPQGFKVEPRQKVFDESGEQIAEFDISIKGALGSSTVEWLIECRDRPSQGPAPAAWIEQLVGRRERFHLDKVFAVSTTGFSRPAQDFARQKGIILRTVSQISEIQSDFKIQSTTYYIEELEFAGPIELDTDDPTYKRTVDIQRPMFKRPEEADFQHFPVFVFRNQQFLRLINPLTNLLQFRYDDWLDLMAGNEHLRIHNLRAPIRIKKFVRTSPVLLATIYSEDDKAIWLEGQFEADTPQGKIKSRAQILKNADGTETAQLFMDEMPDRYFADAFAIHAWNKPTQ